MKATVATRLPAPTPAVVCGPALYRFSVAQYHRMIEAGVLKEGEPAELVEGRVIRRVTRNPPHASTVCVMHRRLAGMLSDDWLLFVRGAIPTRHSEPEPDLAVVRGPIGPYCRRHPGPKDIG